MPVRKIPKNYIHITGIVNSPKAIGEAGFEGGLDYDHLRILAFDPRVKAFEVQPVRIPWRDASGRKHTYTLDTRTLDIDDQAKPNLCEVKPRKILKRDWVELKPKFRAAIRYANQEQSRFKLITEKEIRTQYLKSIRFLLPAVNRGAPLDKRRALLDMLREVVESTPRKLLNGITDDLWKQAEWLPALWYLIGKFQIIADLNQPLSMDMRISLP